jgi:hypothetical protein
MLSIFCTFNSSNSVFPPMVTCPTRAQPLSGTHEPLMPIVIMQNFETQVIVHEVSGHGL